MVVNEWWHSESECQVFLSTEIAPARWLHDLRSDRY